jgi:hypothetical protein
VGEPVRRDTGLAQPAQGGRDVGVHGQLPEAVEHRRDLVVGEVAPGGAPQHVRGHGGEGRGLAGERHGHALVEQAREEQLQLVARAAQGLEPRAQALELQAGLEEIEEDDLGAAGGGGHRVSNTRRGQAGPP